MELLLSLLEYNKNEQYKSFKFPQSWKMEDMVSSPWIGLQVSEDHGFSISFGSQIYRKYLWGPSSLSKEPCSFETRNLSSLGRLSSWERPDKSKWCESILTFPIETMLIRSWYSWPRVWCPAFYRNNTRYQDFINEIKKRRYSSVS